jgi:5-methylcytosine-specific restriction endonuclease McrA
LAQAPINNLTAAQEKAIKIHYRNRCVYCGKKSKQLTLDHLDPLSKGGSHTYTNIVPACQSCNSRKKTGPVLKPVQPLLLVPIMKSKGVVP